MEEYKLLYYFTYIVLILSLLDRIKRMLAHFVLYRKQQIRERKNKRKKPPFKNRR